VKYSAVAVLGVSIVELKGAGGAPTIGDALSFAQPVSKVDKMLLFSYSYLINPNRLDLGWDMFN